MSSAWSAPREAFGEIDILVDNSGATRGAPVRITS
jgi:NADP-dependent 3-hydroxy acid dehydrogenase YdfG